MSDWRNPNMPVQRDYILLDGTKLATVTPEYEQAFRQHLMATVVLPNWRDDPTYDLRRKR